MKMIIRKYYFHTHTHMLYDNRIMILQNELSNEYTYLCLIQDKVALPLDERKRFSANFPFTLFLTRQKL